MVQGKSYPTTYMSLEEFEALVKMLLEFGFTDADVFKTLRGVCVVEEE